MSHPLKIELKRSKYRVLGLVGQGQFGQVFCAVHRPTGRLVALKNLEQNRFPTHKFLRELRFLLSLRHPNIVNCQALEHTRTGRYLVMDYCEGGTLRNLMGEDSRLSQSESVRLVGDILAGLEQAHSRGIVHCDIKPENILLNVQAAGWAARISDFGIARLSQELAGSEFGNTGSPAYMAPERFYGQYSPAADIYSVGVLLFELLAGHRPFSGTPLELMSAHLNRPLSLPDTVPEIWHPILTTALQKLAARRYRSAADMLAALKAAIASSDPDPQAKLAPQPLLQLKVAPRACAFQAQQQQVLTHPIYTQTSTAGSEGIQDSLSAPDSPSDPLPNLLSLYALATNLPWPVTELFLRPQGCFAVTDQAVYHFPYATWANTTPRFVAACSESQVAIAPQGSWLAIAQMTEPESYCLTFRSLPPAETPVKLSPPLQRSLPSQGCRLSQLIALDNRHVVAVFGASERASTYLEVSTRRGDRLGGVSLPTQIDRAILTSIPYRLLTTEPENPETVLLVDLKPFRVTRLAVGMTPKFMTAVPWGYVLANPAGKILFLDQEGYIINQMDGPDHLTAIATPSPHHLILSTWDGKAGNLYACHLKDLELDLLF